MQGATRGRRFAAVATVTKGRRTAECLPCVHICRVPDHGQRGYSYGF